MKNRLKTPWAELKLWGDGQVAACFIEAVKRDPNDAWAFVSKVYSPSLDLDELNEILSDSSQIKVSKAFYLNDSRNYLLRPIYVENPSKNLKRFLHLRMIKEPGSKGGWKICGVEQEDCVKI